MKTFSIKPSLNEKSHLVKCPVCNGSEFKSHWICEGYEFSKCISCNLILQNPQPEFESLDIRYDEEYFNYEKDNDQIFFQLMLKGLEDVGFFCNKFKKEEERFLDIGCATGLLVKHMKDNGWISSGVEICGPAADYGNTKRGVEIFKGTLSEASFADSVFDVVHCSHLIEHLNKPDIFLKEVWRILKPGGIFFCTTPNASGFQAKLFNAGWRSAIADHMFLFSKKTLVKIINKQGFEIKNIKTWGGLGKGCGPQFLKKSLDRLAKKYSFGDVMIIMASKNNKP